MFNTIKNWFKPKIKPVGQGLCCLQPAENAPAMPMVKLPRGVDIEFNKRCKPSDRVMVKITTLSVSDDRLTFHYRGKHGKIVRVWVDSEDKRDRRVDFGDELSGDPLPHLSDLRDIAHVIEWELQQHGESNETNHADKP